MPKERNRINSFHLWGLLGTAAFIDFLQIFFTFIPLVGPFIASVVGFIARIVFWVWFRLLGVGFADKSSRFMVNMSITIIELLPLINFIPSWSIGAWVITKQVKKEDAQWNEKVGNDNQK